MSLPLVNIVNAASLDLKNLPEEVLASDTIVGLCSNAIMTAAAAAFSNAKIYQRTDLFEVDSEIEYDAYNAGVLVQSLIMEALSKIEVNGVSVGDVVMGDLLMNVVREHTLAAGIAGVARGGARKIVVLCGTNEEFGMAALWRLAAGGDCKIGRRYQVSADGCADEALDLERELNSEVRAWRNEELGRTSFTLRAEGQQIDEKLLASNSEAPIFFFYNPALSIHNRHSLAILGALREMRAPTVIVAPRASDEFAEFAGADFDIATPKLSTRAPVTQAAKEICSHIRAAVASLPFNAEDVGPATAFFNAATESRLVNKVRLRIAQVCAYRVMMEKVKPRSVWIPDWFWPDNRVVIDAAWGVAPIYTAHFTTVSAHVRNLPIIEPRAIQLAYGEEVVAAYAARGLPSPAIKLTGGPQNDNLYSDEFQKLRPRTRAKLGLGEGQYAGGCRDISDATRNRK